ncbi:MAG: class I tRNA ligase family protein, partial [Ferruginibacter sp.]
DVYVGGTEHAVGHLLYSRMWTKFLYDRGLISFDEPFKKLVNQGMIQGSSRFVYRVQFPDIIDALEGRFNSNESVFVTQSVYEKIIAIDINNPLARIKFLKEIKSTSKFIDKAKNVITTSKLHVDVNMVDGFELDIEAFKKWKPEYYDAEFILEDGKYICGTEVEKMSKSKYNTVNPDVLVDKYGADTFRMYEMFLGPVEQSKPWDTKGIEGVHRFLKRLWRLFFDEQKGQVWTTNTNDVINFKSSESDPPLPGRGVRGEVNMAGGEVSDAEWKVLHKTIKKIEQDTENFSFNTAVSAFMVCVNELTDLKCHKKEVLEKLLVLLVPYAPHITEELWHALGNEGSILDASYPVIEEKYLVESSKEYPISINGKLRTTINISLDAEQKDVEAFVLGNDIVQKWLEGKAPKKIIFVKNKMVNVVI